MRIRNVPSPHTLVLLSGTAAASAFLLILFQQAYIPSSDDYYYAIFWQGGVSHFLQQTVNHFFTRNGRVLVHLFVSTFAALPSLCYALCCTAMLCGMFLLLVRYQRSGEALSGDGWALAAAGFFLCLLMTDYRVMLGWFLSIADAFNYIFPLVMLGALLRFTDTLSEQRGGMVMLVLWAFLTGATTEQGGAMAIGLLLLTSLERKFKGKSAAPCLWAMAASLLGMLTIFASPATQERVAAEFSLSGLLNSYSQFANSLAAPGLSLRTLAAFSIITGLFPLTKRAPRPLYAGLPLGAVLCAGFFLPPNTGWNNAVCALFFCYLVLTAAALIFCSPYRRSGFLLLAGLGSAGMVMLSQSCSVRVTIPLIEILILCGIFFLTELYVRLGWGGGRGQILLAAGLAAVFVLAAVLQLPALRGARQNYAVLRENERAVEEAQRTHVLTYRDYDPEHAVALLFSSGPLSAFYLQYYQLPPDTQVNTLFTSGPEVCINGQTETVLRYKDRDFFPLRPLVDAKGGSVRMVTDFFLELQVDGETILYHWPTLHTPHGRLPAAWDMLSYYGRYYISQELAQQIGLLDGSL